MKQRTRQWLRAQEEELVDDHSEADDEVDAEDPYDTTALNDILASLQQTEKELGLEYVGRDKGQNRQQRRDHVRTLKRVTRRPVACLQLHHPLLRTLTPNGARRLKRRRAANKVARASRKVNRGRGDLA